MKRTYFGITALVLIIACSLVSDVKAKEDPKEKTPKLDISRILGFGDHLKVSPKAIASSDGKQTVGFDYEYDRRIGEPLSLDGLEIDLSIHSDGLIVAQKEDSPNRLLNHNLRLTIIDLLSFQGKAAVHKPELQRIQSQYYVKWYQFWEDENAEEGMKLYYPELSADKRASMMKQLLENARSALEPYGQLEENNKQGTWPLLDELLAEETIRKDKLFVSFDLNVGAEADQSFSDTQLVGSGQFRGKILEPWLDYPFQLIRGYEIPKNPINRYGGPHFWAGASIVDPTGNESRKELTQDEDSFGRVHVGAYYRTELFGSDEEKNVSLVVLWRYYYEIDAPSAIKNADLDSTSYFKAKFLFPNNLFIEYTDGKLPLDVEGASSVSAGFEFNF